MLVAGELSVSHPGRFTSGKSSSGAIAVWVRARTGLDDEESSNILLLSGLGTPKFSDVQPAAFRYIDWAVGALHGNLPQVTQNGIQETSR
jgi:hypothetical protein